MTRTIRGHLLLCAGLCAALFVLELPAQTPAGPAARLADFAWLAGEWRGETSGENRFTFDTTWSDIRGGVMHGMFRLTDPASDRLLVLEYFTLRETPDGIEMRIRHFDSQLVPWEKGDAIILRLTRADGARFEFENPVHNSPKRTVITRTSPGAFTTRSEIIRDDGAVTLIQTESRRAPAPR